jgi:ribosomal protein L16 Arg81 hydroxylase
MDAALAMLIDPVDAAEFERDYWDRVPLVVQRGVPGYFDDLLTLPDLDRIISATSLRAPDMQVVEAGQASDAARILVPRNGEPSRGVEAIYDHYRDGATVVMTSLEDRWPALARLCTVLAHEITATVWANAYLTPARAQGFRAHHDTHDVFVAQVHGSKHWRLYSSAIQLPLADQGFIPPADGPGAPVQEITLRAGDVMYLPRGTVHDAVCGEEASLHLTIGIAPVVWAAAIQYALRAAARDDVRLRQALPLGFGHGGDRVAVMTDRLAALLGDVMTRIDAGAMAGHAARQTIRRAVPALTGHLSDLETVRSANPRTRFRRRAGLVWSTVSADESVILEFNGKTIRMPSRVAGELGFITATAEFTPADIPGGLEEAGRMRLVTTLVREGFLTFA